MITQETLIGSPLEISKIKRLALIAGEGELPVHVAKTANRMGLRVVPLVLDRKHQRQLQDICKHPGHVIAPGMLKQNLDLLQAEEISHIVFAGKVNKWILLRNPKLDQMAIEAMKQLVRLNDDAVMLWVIEQLNSHGVDTLPQTAFMQDLFIGARQMSRRKPTDEQWRDIHYGFDVAKEMGRLDIGQTIAVKDGMILAVEAIEGTDECLKRAGKLADRKGGTVVKVAKPEQDDRFDVPTVGLRTLKQMKKAGLNVLATEADQTLVLEPEAMIRFADQHDMVFVSWKPDANE